MHESCPVRTCGRYIEADRPYLGICLGLQTLFEGSDETPEAVGLGIIKGRVQRFPEGTLSVPHTGWNGIRAVKASVLSESWSPETKFYFVHSYHVPITPESAEWTLTETDYGVPFVRC